VDALVLSLDGKRRVIRKIHKYTATEFWGEYKNCTICCSRDDEETEGYQWYIQVCYKDSGLLYDGYAPDEVETTEQAVAEAIRGACL